MVSKTQDQGFQPSWYDALYRSSEHLLAYRKPMTVFSILRVGLSNHFRYFSPERVFRSLLQKLLDGSRRHIGLFDNPLFLHQGATLPTVVTVVPVPNGGLCVRRGVGSRLEGKYGTSSSKDLSSPPSVKPLLLHPTCSLFSVFSLLQLCAADLTFGTRRCPRCTCSRDGVASVSGEISTFP